MILLALLLATTPAPMVTPPGEEPVAPYTVDNANAGAAPFSGGEMWQAFHGQAGVERIVERFVDLNQADPRIADIFKGPDMVRLRRVLNEHFCYLLGGGCAYTGRDMKSAHKDLGLQTADFNALVENLQAAMRQEGIPSATQNRLLAKLAPMKRDTVVR